MFYIYIPNNMEEVDISHLGENKTEKDLIDMGNEFKEIVKKKNIELAGLKKLLMMSYSLIKIMNDHGEDMNMLEVLYNYLCDGLTQYLNVEEP